MRCRRKALEQVAVWVVLQDWRERLKPAMQEVAPAVVDAEPPLILLQTRLAQEAKIAPVVEIPDDTLDGEDGGVGQG